MAVDFLESDFNSTKNQRPPEQGPGAVSIGRCIQPLATLKAGIRRQRDSVLAVAEDVEHVRVDAELNVVILSGSGPEDNLAASGGMFDRVGDEIGKDVVDALSIH